MRSRVEQIPPGESPDGVRPGPRPPEADRFCEVEAGAVFFRSTDRRSLFAYERWVMPAIDLLWLLGEALLLVGLLGLFFYEYYWHPAWRKERRIIEACREAFGPEGYLLERLHIRPVGPTGADLFSGVGGLPGPLPYFTYNVETRKEPPDFSGMSSRKIGLVRRYLHSSGAMPHYRREVLRPRGRVVPSTHKGRLRAQ